jgi:hypothetical protein
VLRGALNQAGIDWRKDLEIFELKNPPAVIEAVKSGQVDAGLVWGPHDLRAEQGAQVVSAATNSPNRPCCRLTWAEPAAEPEPGALKAILQAEKFAGEPQGPSPPSPSTSARPALLERPTTWHLVILIPASRGSMVSGSCRQVPSSVGPDHRLHRHQHLPQGPGAWPGESQGLYWRSC